MSLARAAADRFAIARVLFVPAANPPHRASGTVAGYEDRFRMVEIACREDPRFQASRLEEGSDKSYSIHTIEGVRHSIDADPLYFLIGADAFAEISSWHRWKDVVNAVTFVVVSRPGAVFEIPEGATVLSLEELDLPTSSSEIRGRLRNGEFDLPLPAAVGEYIQRHGLYR